MFKIFIFSILCIMSTREVLACATFDADAMNVRSGGSVKHFFSFKDEVKRLIITNYTDVPCVIKLEPHDILQKLDGSYSYLPFTPNRPLYRSLAPYLSVVDNAGKEMLWEEVTIAPNNTVVARINITGPMEQTGTFRAALRANFPESPTSILLTELFYTIDNEIPKLNLEGLVYNSSEQSISYTLKGRGTTYTFVNFEVRMIDPETGFEVSENINPDGSAIPFTAYIRNYWLPGANDERIIKAKFNVRNFNETFKKEFLKNYPGTDMKNKKWVAYVKVRYGIDSENWKTHRYLSLPPKTIEIKND